MFNFTRLPYTSTGFLVITINRVHQHEAENLMTIQNLAIVFGPTLFGQPQIVNGQSISNSMADAALQNTVS